MTKLNLGSGPHYMEGYINIDNYSQYHGNFRVDQEADFFTLEWENNQIDEIIASHIAMYIDRSWMPILLKRWCGWLKEGGVLIMETGNVKKVAQTILDFDDPSIIEGDYGMKQLFGWDTTAGHTWAWCPETLKPLFLEGGFTTVNIKNGVFHNPQRDFLLEGIK
tara:strand:+ start:3748 stop:4239 length:492 start_codon:yes stop_codon:yes gene_type:complete